MPFFKVYVIISGSRQKFNVLHIARHPIHGAQHATFFDICVFPVQINAIGIIYSNSYVIPKIAYHVTCFSL